ncbi:MAG: hypothetical protein IPI73_12075 [Betaproteobacteria bacterium]|nr:hypothetical protein [Betaproteobacteria bacterium]
MLCSAPEPPLGGPDAGGAPPGGGARGAPGDTRPRVVRRRLGRLLDCRQRRRAFGRFSGQGCAGANAFGYNAATGEFGDMMAMGIIDPTKVTRLGLQNAASIASLILTTDCIIVDAPKHGAPEPEDLPRGD